METLGLVSVRTRLWRSNPRAAAGGSALLIAMAIGTLALGTAGYLSDHPLHQAQWRPPLAAVAGHHLFGAIGAWLPSFVHPFAFSLLTAVALPAASTPRYGPCIFWCCVNLAFEWGQHPSVREPLALTLHQWLDPIGLGMPLANYFLQGTFDPGDIVAVILGGAAAAALLRLRCPRQEWHHAN